VKIASVFRRLPRDRPWLGLAAGAAFFVLASVLRWLLGGLSEGFGPMTFLPAILLAGLFGGIRVGLGVAVVCALIAWTWFFPPYGTFVLAPSHVITMVIFILTAGLELYVIRTLNIAISDLSAARERSNTLFRELQHRVANNLQSVASLLRLRKRTLDADSAGARALDAAERRLDLMSRIHRRLNSPEALSLPMQRYLEELCLDLIKASDTPQIRLAVKASPLVVLDLESLMSVSLIVAELVTNSLKHAFRDRADGSIEIDFAATGQTYTLTVADDGCGLTETFGRTRRGLGQGILQGLAAQLDGRISFEHGPGTTARVVFPAP
jgi:two-component sensor histidine kinase